ncbi:MAG: hypothetical protein HZC51_02040 [Nitrospirae bacterium]|nr:hypothetical protein [Nitrospirota bacterium]
MTLAAADSGGDWKKAFRDAGLDMAFYAGRERGELELFPWDFIDTGIMKGYLWSERERSRDAKHTPSCRVGKCRICGVC